MAVVPDRRNAPPKIPPKTLTEILLTRRGQVPAKDLKTIATSDSNFFLSGLIGTLVLSTHIGNNGPQTAKNGSRGWFFTQFSRANARFKQIFADFG
tara:strand:- start:5099 stop:5386 length:288 start_codon:yes stop_codon:yes gene_type:complete